MDLFLFGTLRHLPLLEVVAGEAVNTIAATAPGFRIARVEGQSFPMLSPEQGGAHGLLIQNLSEEALARIDYYEAAFDYVRETIALSDGSTVNVYVPQPGRWTPAEDWDLTAWAEKWGLMATIAAEEAMAQFPILPAAEMGRRYRQMLTRAHARVMSDTSQGGGNSDDVFVSSKTRTHSGFFAMDVYSLKFRRFDGSLSAEVEREAFVSFDAAVVLPYDPVRDRVLLVEQFRLGAYGRGDPKPWLMEAIAGRVDPGESSEETVRREAVEEAGVTINDLHLVFSGYPSPGATTEFIDVYVGIADLPEDLTGVGGLATEEEDIRSHLMDWALFDEKLCANGFNLMQLEIAGHWLARNRERLRGLA